MSELKAVAARRGVSVAAVVRSAVEAELARAGAEERVERALEVVGAYRSGRPDLSADHDAHLAEAFGDESRR